MATSVPYMRDGEDMKQMRESAHSKTTKYKNIPYARETVKISS